MYRSLDTQQDRNQVDCINKVNKTFDLHGSVVFSSLSLCVEGKEGDMYLYTKFTGR